MSNEFKIKTRNPELFLRVQRGHFATMHSHTNYYIDVTTQKYRMSEAKAVAKEIVSFYRANTIIDTIICLDGTEVIGAFVAQELSDASFMNLNAHHTIYILSPEFIGNGQMVFRDNTSPMIENKHVLILAASVTTPSGSSRCSSTAFRNTSSTFPSSSGNLPPSSRLFTRDRLPSSCVGIRKSNP